GDLTARSAALQEIQDALGLDSAPLRIECVDVSHVQGTDVVASLVVFEDGLARKSDYRRFEIRGGAGRASIAASAASEERNAAGADRRHSGAGRASIAASAASEERNAAGADRRHSGAGRASIAASEERNAAGADRRHSGAEGGDVAAIAEV